MSNLTTDKNIGETKSRFEDVMRIVYLGIAVAGVNALCAIGVSIAFVLI
jgi:hypothetical protein